VRQVHVGARTDGELVVELELVLTPLNDFAVVEQHTVVMHAAPVGAYADPIEAQVRHHLSLEVRAGERLLDTVPDPVLAHLDLPAEAMAADACTGETWVGVEERPGCGRKSADAKVRRWRGESEGVTQGGDRRTRFAGREVPPSLDAPPPCSLAAAPPCSLAAPPCSLAAPPCSLAAAPPCSLMGIASSLW
jgi:hypothetical protein